MEKTVSKKGAVILGVRLLVLKVGAPDTLNSLHVIGIIVVSLAYMLTLLATRTVKVGTDRAGDTLDIRRVRAAMMLALVAVLVSALVNGDNGIT